MIFAVNVKNGQSKRRRKMTLLTKGIEIYDVQIFNEAGEYEGGVAHFVNLEDAQKEVADMKKHDKDVDVRIIPDVIIAMEIENGFTAFKTKNKCSLSMHGLKLTTYEEEDRIRKSRTR